LVCLIYDVFRDGVGVRRIKGKVRWTLKKGRRDACHSTSIFFQSMGKKAKLRN
jgi:hypothetical protein